MSRRRFGELLRFARLVLGNAEVGKFGGFGYRFTRSTDIGGPAGRVLLLLLQHLAEIALAQTCSAGPTSQSSPTTSRTRVVAASSASASR
jgi:hypothetical protein